MNGTLQNTEVIMMKAKFTRFWLCSLAAVLAASFYPLLMGVRVVSDMLRDGTVLKENYPKYVIPYTAAETLCGAGQLGAVGWRVFRAGTPV